LWLFFLGKAARNLEEVKGPREDGVGKGVIEGAGRPIIEYGEGIH